MINGDLGALRGLVTGLLSHDRSPARPVSPDGDPAAPSRDPAVTVSPSTLGLLTSAFANAPIEDAGVADKLRAGLSPLDRFTQKLEKSLASLGADFDRLLRIMGVGPDETARIVHGLFGKFATDPGGALDSGMGAGDAAAGQPGASGAPTPGTLEVRKTQVTLEVHRINITVNQDDHSVSVGVESASLSVESTYATLSSGAADESAGTAESSIFSAEQRGLFFQAEGLEGVAKDTFLDKLATMFGNPRDIGGFNGRLSLRPGGAGTGDLDGETGPFNLMLDIVEPLLSRVGGDRSAEGPDKDKENGLPQPVYAPHFDIRA